MTSPLIEALIRRARLRACTALALILLALIAALMQVGLLDVAELASQSVGAGIALLLTMTGSGR